MWGSRNYSWSLADFNSWLRWCLFTSLLSAIACRKYLNLFQTWISLRPCTELFHPITSASSIIPLYSNFFPFFNLTQSHLAFQQIKVWITMNSLILTSSIYYWIYSCYGMSILSNLLGCGRSLSFLHRSTITMKQWHQENGAHDILRPFAFILKKEKKNV